MNHVRNCSAFRIGKKSITSDALLRIYASVSICHIESGLSYPLRLALLDTATFQKGRQGFRTKGEGLSSEEESPCLPHERIRYAAGFSATNAISVKETVPVVIGVTFASK